MTVETKIAKVELTGDVVTAIAQVCDMFGSVGFELRGTVPAVEAGAVLLIFQKATATSPVAS